MNETEGAHYYSRHGAQTTLEEQLYARQQGLHLMVFKADLQAPHEFLVTKHNSMQLNVQKRFINKRAKQILHLTQGRLSEKVI